MGCKSWGILRAEVTNLQHTLVDTHEGGGGGNGLSTVKRMEREEKGGHVVRDKWVRGGAGQCEEPRACRRAVAWCLSFSLIR